MTLLLGKKRLLLIIEDDFVCGSGSLLSHLLFIVLP